MSEEEAKEGKVTSEDFMISITSLSTRIILHCCFSRTDTCHSFINCYTRLFFLSLSLHFPILHPERISSG